MQHDRSSLAALIGSRICHDLINPIGAISNGLELAGMAGMAPGGPELSLIQQSCDNATARIRFFRIAFGNAGDTYPIGAAEVQKTLADHYAGTRIMTSWPITESLGRDVTQFGYLSVLCLENALPQGGQIQVTTEPGRLVTTAQADTVQTDGPCWTLLAKGAFSGDSSKLRPADVQFPLFARLCKDDGIAITVRSGQGWASLTLDLSDRTG